MRSALFLATALAMMPWSASSGQALGPFAVTNISEALAHAYNDEDAAALYGLLAPGLQARYTPDDIRKALILCRALTGDIFRLSTPSWGTRSYGFFGLYAETGVFDMVLEIDPAEKIVHWVVSDRRATERPPASLSGEGLPAINNGWLLTLCQPPMLSRRCSLAA
jgi:hypothetical protein